MYTELGIIIVVACAAIGYILDLRNEKKELQRRIDRILSSDRVQEALKHDQWEATR